jgi:predicted Zn-dependent peptidase
MMHKKILILLFLGLSCLISSCGEKGSVYQIPVEYHTLDNGLKVVLSEDHTAPTVVVAVYYNIGFRIEPKDRTGFAHLFEHMMFQGSENLGKMELIRLVQNSGGTLNGSTRFDFTNYFEILPAHKLETALWAEADRMKGLAITQENLTNQQGVVTNEVKVNVLNQPYGGFPWLDMPQYANKNWYNAHNFYGELKDLEAASLTDVQAFFDTFYAPNNAVVVVTGDFVSADALDFVKKYFAAIPSAELPEKPDLSEPRQEEAKRFVKEDRLANRPALAFAYHIPEKNTPEYYAMGLLDQILIQGNDSQLYQVLVQKKGLTGSVSGGINLLGNMFNYDGPILWTGYLFHDNEISADTILQEIQQVIEKLQTEPVEQAVLERAIVKMRSNLYDSMEDYYGAGLADLLACFALFENDPARINHIEKNFRAVTPELMMQTAKDYLRTTNQTVLIVKPQSN